MNISGHSCTVEKQSSGSFLPPLSKDANCFQRFTRAYKKFIQVSERDPLTQEYFRSTTGFLNERKRHARSRYSHIIHPFSDFAYFRKIVLVTTLWITYICSPLVNNFTENGICETPWICFLEVVTSIIYVMDIIVKFYMAVENRETKHVLLVHRKIVRKYILSVGFWLDLVSALSFCILYHITNKYRKVIYLSYLRYLKIFNFCTFLSYLNHIMKRRNVSPALMEIGKYLALTVLLVHWTTIFTQGITFVHSIMPQSAHIFLGFSIPALYFSAFFENIGILLGARSFWNQNCSMVELSVIAICVVVGNVFMLVLTVTILNQVLNQWSLQTQYLQITDQLKEFMKYKKLPLTLRQKIEGYFEYKFRNKYFRETLITSILSDKMKREINIHVCKRLVQQAAFLANLPTKTLGYVLTHLKSEVFLPNDTIIRSGSLGDCMYFLSSGTVLVTTPSGKEVCHLQDGAYFGEIALLSKDIKRTANVIALEMCETYRLDKKVFRSSIKKYPECLQVIQEVADIRQQETNTLEEMHKEQLFHATFIGEKEDDDSIKERK